MKFASFIIPLLIIALLVYSAIKKVDVYQAFTVGVKNAIDLVFSIFPFICAIIIMVKLLDQSGVTAWLINLLTPFLSFLGIPKEIAPLLVLKPFSGSGSLAVLSDIYAKYGTDTYIGVTASVVFGSSETVFYIAGIYFAKTKTKRLAKPIAISLFATFASAVFSSFLCKFQYFT